MARGRTENSILNPPTQQDLNWIYETSKKGVSEKSLGPHFGICYSTFLKRKKKYPELDAVINRSRANMEVLVVGQLFKMITNENHLIQKTSWIRKEPSETS